MSTLLERIQAVLTLCPEATGKLYLSATANMPIACEDVAEIVTALKATPSSHVTQVFIERDRVVMDLQQMLAEAREGHREARAQAQRLESTNTELSAVVAQMTSGVPVLWSLTHSNGRLLTVFADKARVETIAKDYDGAIVEPLFRATHTPVQAAELAAKVEALGIELAREKRMREETRLDLVKAQDQRDAARSTIHAMCGERDALRARIDTLMDGERLTKDALAAAEKRATDAEAARERTFHTMDGIVKERNEAWERKEKAEKRNSMLYAAAVLNKQALDAHIAESERFRIRAEKAEADRDEALTAYQAAKRARDAAEQSEAATAEGHDAWKAACEKAEARVKVLEGDAVPATWVIDHDGKIYGTTYSSEGSARAALPYCPSNCKTEPLYRHPPKTGEPVAWRVNIKAPLVYVSSGAAHRVAQDNAVSVTPLYEAPPPAALGVTDERFACVVSGGPGGEFLRLLDGQSRRVGSRAEAQGAAHDDETASAVRLIDADAPTVDVAALRALADKAEAGGFTIQASSIRKLVG